MGDVLLQDGHPLAYVSKPLGPKTQGLSIYEKEYLAILIAVEHRRSYLQLAEFIIFTDQKSLTHLNDQRRNTMWQQKVFTKILGLRYCIVYKKGSDNTAADALSRCVHDSGVCCAISVATPPWCEELRMSYEAIITTHQLKIFLSNGQLLLLILSRFLCLRVLFASSRGYGWATILSCSSASSKLFTVLRWGAFQVFWLPQNGSRSSLHGPAFGNTLMFLYSIYEGGHTIRPASVKVEAQ